MNHHAYELALIRRDHFLREASARRLAAASAPSAHHRATAKQRQNRLQGLRWLVRTSQAPPRLTTRGH